MPAAQPRPALPVARHPSRPRSHHDRDRRPPIAVATPIASFRREVVHDRRSPGATPGQHVRHRLGRQLLRPPVLVLELLQELRFRCSGSCGGSCTEGSAKSRRGAGSWYAADVRGHLRARPVRHRVSWCRTIMPGSGRRSSRSCRKPVGSAATSTFCAMPSITCRVRSRMIACGSAGSSTTGAIRRGQARPRGLA